jgi:acid phosphatase
MPHRWIATAIVAGILWVETQAGGAADKKLPQPAHVVVVIFENHTFDQIIDPERAPFIYDLATRGALFVNSFAVAHPSQPNYFALFSGSTQAVRDNDHDHSFDAPSLASALNAAQKSFVGYIETGSPREHNPWESFNNVSGVERNLTELPNDFTQLPTVAFIIPNLNHDMHGAGWRSWLKNRLGAVVPRLNRYTDERLVRAGDIWLKHHLGSYAEWANAHNSLLIVTFDEDDDHASNHIPTLILGAHVRPGRYVEGITHYNVFSTLLAMYALAPFAEALHNPPIYSIWVQ